MAKRRNDEATAVGPDNKKRKQGLIHNTDANPVGDDGLSQCFRVVKARMHVSLAPMFSATPIEGIKKQHLDPLLLQYENNVHGIVISYSNVRLLKNKGTSTPLGKVMNECPFSYFWIACDIIVWSPQPGDIIDGWISVQSPGHIALLINDTFNASIKRSEIPEDWEFMPQEDDENGSKSLGYWKDGEGNRVDGKLTFTVKRFLHGGRTVLVMGTLLTADDVNPPRYDGSKGDSKHDYSSSIEDSRPKSKESTKATPKKITFDD